MYTEEEKKNIPSKNARVYWHDTDKVIASTVFVPEKDPKEGEEDKYFDMAEYFYDHLGSNWAKCIVRDGKVHDVYGDSYHGPLCTTKAKEDGFLKEADPEEE